MARKKHYHVLVGMEGGYMPDSNYYADTRKDAVDIALEEVRRHRDQGRGYTVTGNARDGIWIFHSPYDGAHTLCTYIEIPDCEDPDCVKHRDDEY